jgi:hypothetical protein
MMKRPSTVFVVVAVIIVIVGVLLLYTSLRPAKMSPSEQVNHGAVSTNNDLAK